MCEGLTVGHQKWKMHENTATSGVVRGIFWWILMLHMHAGVGGIVKLTRKPRSHSSTNIISSFESLLHESHRFKYARKRSSNTSHPTKRLSGTTSSWLEVHHLNAVNRDKNHPKAVGISQQRILALPEEYLRSCKWSCGWVNLLHLLWWRSTRPFHARFWKGSTGSSDSETNIESIDTERPKPRSLMVSEECVI